MHTDYISPLRLREDNTTPDELKRARRLHGRSALSLYADLLRKGPPTTFARPCGDVDLPNSNDEDTLIERRPHALPLAKVPSSHRRQFTFSETPKSSVDHSMTRKSFGALRDLDRLQTKPNKLSLGDRIIRAERPRAEGLRGPRRDDREPNSEKLPFKNLPSFGERPSFGDRPSLGGGLATADASTIEELEKKLIKRQHRRSLGPERLSYATMPILGDKALQSRLTGQGKENRRSEGFTHSPCFLTDDRKPKIDGRHGSGVAAGGGEGTRKSANPSSSNKDGDSSMSHVINSEVSRRWTQIMRKGALVVPKAVDVFAAEHRHDPKDLPQGTRLIQLCRVDVAGKLQPIDVNWKEDEWLTGLENLLFECEKALNKQREMQQEIMRQQRALTKAKRDLDVARQQQHEN